MAMTKQDIFDLCDQIDTEHHAPDQARKEFMVQVQYCTTCGADMPLGYCQNCLAKRRGVGR